MATEATHHMDVLHVGFHTWNKDDQDSLIASLGGQAFGHASVIRCCTVRCVDTNTTVEAIRVALLADPRVRYVEYPPRMRTL